MAYNRCAQIATINQFVSLTSRPFPFSCFHWEEKPKLKVHSCPAIAPGNHKRCEVTNQRQRDFFAFVCIGRVIQVQFPVVEPDHVSCPQFSSTPCRGGVETTGHHHLAPKLTAKKQLTEILTRFSSYSFLFLYFSYCSQRTVLGKCGIHHNCTAHAHRWEKLQEKRACQARAGTLKRNSEMAPPTRGIRSLEP